MARVGMLALGVALAACNVVAGLPDFTDAPPGTGAGGTTSSVSGGSGGVAGGVASSGGGGIGGSPACTPAPDWTSSFDAVWTFDAAAKGELGAAAAGDDLVVGADVAPSTLAQQGAGSALVSGGDGFSNAAQALALTEPATWGMWLRYQEDIVFSGSAIAMSRFAAQAGYRLLRGGAGRANCQIGNGSTIQAQSAAAHLLEDGAWHHVVCRAAVRRDMPSNKTLTLTFDGESDGTASYAGEMTNAGVDFEIPSSTNPFGGNVDEAFVVGVPLTLAAISRIHACGIDGSRCCCVGASYEDCGRYPGSCGDLAADLPCDTDAPPVQ